MFFTRWDLNEDKSSDPAIALRIENRLPLHRARCSRYVEFKNSADRDIRLSSIGILRSHEAKRIYTINKKTATGSALVPHHPISVTVLTHHEQRNSQTRGMFGFLLLYHINSP